jgi:Tol biopolymer transport system component
MAQRLSRRLAPLALLAAVLAAVPGPHDGARAAVPGKNGRIAFVRSAGAGPLEEVFMVSPGSGLTANLTSDPFTSDTAPSWSPDGLRVAFSRFLPGEGNRVFTVAPGGKGLTQVTFGGGPTAFNDVHPAWSPDGARIAFARGGDQDDGLPFHIHTVSLASGRTSQVTGGKVQDLMPSWQPL